MKTRICSYCVMDTTDPEIVFDERGRCNHCRMAEEKLKEPPYSLTPEEKKIALKKVVAQIRNEGKGKKYNCIIGVSGGVDSTYLAYVAKKELGLNPLAVHLDNGWNSELSVANIEKTLKKLEIDLYTYVIDWEEFKELQLSFLKASTPDSEVPTDHAILSILYKLAAQENVSYIVIGTNLATESIMPRAWSRGHADWKYISFLQKRYGTKPLRSLPHRTLFDEIYYRFIKRIRRIYLLDYIVYSKENAIKILEKELGWRSYGEKHYESVYTRFFQSYILPKKFNFDKRKPHFSAMIVSGQISREAALKELENLSYNEKLVKEEKEYVAKKFGLSLQEFEEIMVLPPKRFEDYPSYNSSWHHKMIVWLSHIFHRLGWVT